VRIYPESDRQFFNLVDDRVLELVRDERGAVVGMYERRDDEVAYGRRR
jgi:hypothetical protein